MKQGEGTGKTGAGREPFYKDHHVTIWNCDVLEGLEILGNESAQCVVTSPPYWGLRDYNIDGQIGLELAPEEYVAKLTEVFREVRRVLKRDGTLWLNLGDSYFGSWGDYVAPGSTKHESQSGTRWRRPGYEECEYHSKPPTAGHHPFLKKKDLVGIPWRVALALQADGWYLRSDIIWSKPNPMPESVKDRPTRSHEYLFLMSKSGKYYYDQEALMETVTGNAHPRGSGVNPKAAKAPSGWNTGEGSHHTNKGRYPRIKQNVSFSSAVSGLVDERNVRSVWEIPAQTFTGQKVHQDTSHFATFPEALVERCVKAGSRKGDVVLDPFVGSGTTLWVAKKLERQAVGIELKPEYCALARERNSQQVMTSAS